VKILLVHNFYGSTAPSGENTAYLAESDLLRSHGHTVVEFTRTSDEILFDGHVGALRGAVSTVWNPFALRRLKRTIKMNRPDLVHVHNTFPLLSPSVFYATRDEEVPTVMTMHNYRVACSAATAVRNDEACLLCLERRSVLPALRYGCYRKSRIATLPVSAMIAFHNAAETWNNNVDAFITLTEFQRAKMLEFGIHAGSLHVKPHFMQQPPEPVPWSARDEKCVFVGRLYEAKGIHVLVEAWKRWGDGAPRLEIIGDGPMRETLSRVVDAGGLGGRVTFTGNVTHAEAIARLSKAKLLILPSLCFEGFPMVVQEAFALEVPVAASNIGSLPFIVKEKMSGVLFAPGSPEGLQESVWRLMSDPGGMVALGKGARREFDEKYTAEKNHAMLMEIYRLAALRRSARKR